MKFLNVGMSMMTGVLGKVLGGQFLKDVQTFVAAMDSMFGGFRTRADATYKLLQAPGTAFLVVAAPERDALREAAYFVERLAAEDMPLAGLVLNRVHGSGADRLSAERALAAAESLAGENLEDPRIVDQSDGKAGLRNSPDSYGSSDSPDRPDSSGPGAGTAAEVTGSADGAAAAGDTGAAAGDAGAAGDAEAAAGDAGAAGDAEAAAGDAEAAAGDAEAAERSVDLLAAGLLRLHADRMHLLSREQRTRDRFTALHPEVAVTEVAALPGDVHDLAGLRDIGDRLAAGRPELPDTRA